MQCEKNVVLSLFTAIKGGDLGTVKVVLSLLSSARTVFLVCCPACFQLWSAYIVLLQHCYWHLNPSVSGFNHPQDLVMDGADLECQDLNQDTPLIIAATNNHPPIVEYLISKGTYILHMHIQRTPLCATCVVMTFHFLKEPEDLCSARRCRFGSASCLQWHSPYGCCSLSLPTDCWNLDWCRYWKFLCTTEPMTPDALKQSGTLLLGYLMDAGIDGRLWIQLQVQTWIIPIVMDKLPWWSLLEWDS